LFRGFQPAASMVLDRNRQCFGNRCHGVNYGNPPRLLQSRLFALSSPNAVQEGRQMGRKALPIAKG
jgi:hypothetical protein